MLVLEQRPEESPLLSEALKSLRKPPEFPPRRHKNVLIAVLGNEEAIETNATNMDLSGQVHFAAPIPPFPQFTRAAGEAGAEARVVTHPVPPVRGLATPPGAAEATQRAEGVGGPVGSG